MRFAIDARGIRETQVDDAITRAGARVDINVVAAVTRDNARDRDKKQETALPPTNATNDLHNDRF